MKRSAIASLIGLTLSSYAIADETSNINGINLNPTVVTGNRLPQQLSEVMLSVSVITKEEIDRLQPQDLSSLLQGEPGIETLRSGGLGMQTSIFMRGAGSNQVLVLVDGLKITDEYTNSVPLESIPIAQVERVEILRGNASALYGSNAVGGVIQIFTKSGTANAGPYGSISTGSRNTQNLVAGYNGKYNDTSFNFSFNHQQTDGFPTLNPSQNNQANGIVANLKNNTYESNNISANVSQLIAQGHEVGLKILASETNNTFDSAGNVNGITFNTSPTGFDYLEQMNTKTLISQVYSKDAITDFWNSTVKLGVTNRTYRVNYNDQDLVGAPLGIYNNHQTDLSWINDFVINSNQTLLVGIQTNNLTANVNDIYNNGYGSANFKGTRTVNSIFSGYTAKFDAVGVQVNVRHDYINTGESATTGLFGLSYDLTNHWKLAGNISNAFSAPTSNELYGPYGNANLNPEHDDSQEASIQYLESNTLARIVVFNRTTKNLITNNSSSPYEYENINKASNQGIEFTAKTLIGRATVKASATFQDPVNEITNTQLLRRAKEFGSLDVSYPVDQLSIGAQLVASSATLDASSEKNNGYSVVNLFAQYRYSKNWSANVRVENLFDRSYQQVYGYNTPRVGAFFTLQYSPGKSENKK
ncbi:MAG: TonB-dependent receptor [Methylophilaceae bacterium]